MSVSLHYSYYFPVTSPPPFLARDLGFFLGLGGSGPPGGEIPGSNQGPPRDPPGASPMDFDLLLIPFLKPVFVIFCSDFSANQA